MHFHKNSYRTQLSSFINLKGSPVLAYQRKAVSLQTCLKRPGQITRSDLFRSTETGFIWGRGLRGLQVGWCPTGTLLLHSWLAGCSCDGVQRDTAGGGQEGRGGGTRGAVGTHTREIQEEEGSVPGYVNPKPLKLN